MSLNIGKLAILVVIIMVALAVDVRAAQEAKHLGSVDPSIDASKSLLTKIMNRNKSKQGQYNLAQQSDTAENEDDDLTVVYTSADGLASGDQTVSQRGVARSIDASRQISKDSSSYDVDLADSTKSSTDYLMADSTSVSSLESELQNVIRNVSTKKSQQYHQDELLKGMSNLVAVNAAYMPLSGYKYEPHSIQNKHSVNRTFKNMAGYNKEIQVIKEETAVNMTMYMMEKSFDTYIGIKQDGLYNITQGDEQTWNRWIEKYFHNVDEKNDAVGVMYVDNFDTDAFWNAWYIPKTHPLDEIAQAAADSPASLTEMNQQNIEKHNDEFVDRFVKYAVDSYAFDQAAYDWLQKENNSTVDQLMDSLKDLQELKSEYHLQAVNSSYAAYEPYISLKRHKAKDFVVGGVFNDMLKTFDNLSTELLTLNAASARFSQLATETTYNEMQMSNHTIEMEFDVQYAYDWGNYPFTTLGKEGDQSQPSSLGPAMQDRLAHEVEKYMP